MWRYLKGSGESFTEGIEDGAALVQFKLTRFFTKILSHRLSNFVQRLEGGLRFCDPGFSTLRTTAGHFIKSTKWKHIFLQNKVHIEKS